MRHAGVCDDLRADSVGVEEMEQPAGRACEPADGSDPFLAGEDCDFGLLGWIPQPVWSALPQALEARGRGQDREQHVLASHREVVDLGGVGCLEPFFSLYPAMCVRDIVGDVACGLAFCGKAEEDQFTGLGVDLGMGGGGAAGEPAVIGPGAEGLEGVGVELDRGTVFLQGQESVAVHQHVGVGRAAVAAPDAGIISEGVPVGAEQGLAGGALELEFLGAHIAAAKVDVAVLEPEQADHAVAVDDDVLSEARWKLGFRRYAVEGSLQMRGDLTFHFELEYVCFDPAWAIETAVDREIWKARRHGNTVSNGSAEDLRLSG